jgi:PKD repeat protein
VRKATVTVDGSASADPDGTVASYAWSFGDGTTGSGVTASHTYAAGGTYTVTLTVTDDAGATATTTSTVTATPNKAPTAAFSTAVTDRTVGLDASASADPDGTVASYAWNFGDGATGSGATTSHTYTTDGTFPVTLTVTDDDGATTTVSQSVSVAAPVIVAADAFNRTVASGLGSADTGGAWTTANGSTRQSVAPGAATLRLDAAGNLTGSYLGAVSQTSADVLTTFSLSAAPTGSGASVYVTGRRVGTNLEYRARLRFLANGTVGLAFTKLAGSSSEVLIGGEVIVPGLSYSPGAPLNVRVQVSGTGTTQLAATVWPAGSAQPGTATVTRTDTEATLQAAGGLGLSAYLSGSATAPLAVRFTTLSVTPVR